MNDMLQRVKCLGLLAALTWSALGCASAPKTGKHLFILSGQSNMTGTLEQAFTQRVQERLGQDNATVVMRMKSGRGIRFWVADYGQPHGRGLVDKKMSENGSEYGPLIEAATAAKHEGSFDTVGFIWMQGESDANNRLSEVYEESFIKLIHQLEEDLDREDLYFVIGRISDYGVGGPQDEHWRRVRDAQVRLGQSHANAWIDTDDLNGGGPDRPNGDLHYPREQAVVLGQRFADKALERIDQE